MAKVFLDAGHGGSDPGAVGNGIKEKDITLKVALRVGEILTSNYSGISVVYSRTNDATLSLSDRTNKANANKCNYFLSIHVNAGGGTGYEDFIYDKMATNSPTDKDRQKIHNEVVKVLAKYGIKNRGMKKANHHVTRESNMSASLVETLFIDTVSDANLLKNPSFIEDISQAYARGVANIVGGVVKVATPTTSNSGNVANNGKLYRVQVGAFGSKSNAEALAKEIRAKGYPTTIKYE